MLRTKYQAPVTLRLRIVNAMTQQHEDMCKTLTVVNVPVAGTIAQCSAYFTLEVCLHDLTYQAEPHNSDLPKDLFLNYGA